MRFRGSDQVTKIINDLIKINGIRTQYNLYNPLFNLKLTLSRKEENSFPFFT